MRRVMKSEEIFRRVREVVARELGIETRDIAWESRLVTDLGAEKTDLLDLVFRLQREFKMDTIPAGHLFPKLTHEMTDAEGALTGKGVGLLLVGAKEASLAHLDLEPGKRLEDLQTVGMLCRYVRDRFTDLDTAFAVGNLDLGGEG